METTEKSLQSSVSFEKAQSDIIAKNLIVYFGSVWFLGGIFVFSIGWIFINSGILSEILPLDPYPFIALFIVVQLFAIFLSVIVLISQNRQSEIAEIRQQISLEINVRAEQEITKILQMVDKIHLELGIKQEDKELDKMKEKTDIAEIKEEVELVIEEEKKILSELE